MPMHEHLFNQEWFNQGLDTMRSCPWRPAPALGVYSNTNKGRNRLASPFMILHSVQNNDYFFCFNTALA